MNKEISDFKALIMPENDSLDINEKKINEKKYNEIFSFFKSRKVIIKHKDKILYDFTSDNSGWRDFAYNKIRSWCIEINGYENDKVPWQQRRNLINEMNFIQKEGLIVDDLYLEKLMKELNTNLETINLDDKIKFIANSLENVLWDKENSNFLCVKDHKIKNYLIQQNEDIKDFRRILHNWRHAKEDDLNFINELSSEEKLAIFYKGMSVLYALGHTGYIKKYLK